MKEEEEEEEEETSRRRYGRSLPKGEMRGRAGGCKVAIDTTPSSLRRFAWCDKHPTVESSRRTASSTHSTLFSVENSTIR